MASTDLRTILQLWNQSDQDSERKLKKFLLAGLDKVMLQASDLAAKIKKSSPISNPVVRWMEANTYDFTVTGQLSSTTITFTGYVMGAAIAASTIKQIVRVGTILERPSDGVQMEVTDVSGLASAPFTATVTAYGGTTLSDDSAAITYDIIQELWTDYTDASGPRSIDWSARKVGTQIFAETFEMPWTAMKTKWELVGNQQEMQIKELIWKLRTHLARSIVRSRPKWSGSAWQYGDEVQDPTLLGIMNWPVVTQAELANTNVYVDLSSEAITQTDIDDLARNLYLDEMADYDRGNWVAAVHPIMNKYLQDFDISHRRTDENTTTAGFSIDTIHTKIGKDFPIVVDRHIRPSLFSLVNLDAFEYGFYNEDEMTRKQISTDGRYERWLITFQAYGTVARKPRSNIGQIYGCATT